MQLETFDDPRAFLDEHGDWLHGDEARNSTLLGVAKRCADGDGYGEVPPWFVVVRDANGARVSAAWRTPPFGVGLTAGPGEAIEAIHAHAVAHDPDFPGFVGPLESCEAFARCCLERDGARTDVVMEQMLFRLDRVEDSGSAAGAMRAATRDDLPLAADWGARFAEEIGEAGPTVPEQMRRMVGAGRVRLWDDGGPASIAAVTRESRNGASISWVYTPRDRRGQGYATALVAALSQELLDGGKAFCTLFTDLANPTSNGIYGRIGYREIGRHRKVRVVR